MLSTSATSQNIQSDPKPKKTYRKVKNKQSNPSAKSDITNEILTEDISGKPSTSSREKLEKISTTQSNKNGSFLKYTGEVPDTKILMKEKPFITTLQDFPELKVNNDSSLCKFSAANNNNTRYNKSWGNKNEMFPSLSYMNINSKNKADVYNGRNKLAQNTGKDNAVMCEVREEQRKTDSNAEINKQKELVSLQEITVQCKKNPNKKKRTDPVFINLYDVLNINKSKTRIRPQRFLKSKFQRHKNTEQLSGNYLDSSNPKRLRGKHREVKKKTLTNLKLAIIKGRIMKQKLREKSVAAYFGNEGINFIDNIDFKTEIKIYLKELNERKLKEASQNKVKENSSSGNINKEVTSTEKNMKKNEKKDKIIPLITPEGTFKFSSKFREYCDNIITPDLNSAVSSLIKESVSLQDKSFLRDPIKAKARKRHVSGIREVRKYLIMKKLKLIVIAPNLEKLQMEGSLHDVISDLKSLAQDQNIPYAFALDRYKLGRFTKKNIPVSAFAILTYEGIEELFHNVIDMLQDAKKEFSEIMKLNAKKEEDIKTAEVNAKVLASFISAFKAELKISDEKNESDLK